MADFYRTAIISTVITSQGVTIIILLVKDE
jgi:hypothetical protein